MLPGNIDLVGWYLVLRSSRDENSASQLVELS